MTLFSFIFRDCIKLFLSYRYMLLDSGQISIGKVVSE